MSIIRFAIRRPTAISMFCLAVLLLGIASFARLPLELMPQVDYPKLTVSTSWYDTSPEVVEAFVTSPIEAVANTVTGVRKVDSVSEEGQSRVNIEFSRGTDMDFAALELNEKLSLVREELPYGAQQPRIEKYVPREFRAGQFMSFHLTGPYSLQELRRFALEKIRGPLLSLDGVAHVRVIGGRDREIRIALDRQKLNTFALSTEQVRGRLRDLDVRCTAGKIIEGGSQYTLTIVNRLRSTDEIEDLVVAHNDGRYIRLKDVGWVRDGFGEPTSLSRINSNPEVSILIDKELGTNTIKVADAVLNKVAELEHTFPPGLKLIKDRDQSEKIRQELKELGYRVIFILGIIFFVLWIFLRRIKTSLIILSTIGFSVLMTLNCIYFAGISLNLLTLTGLALGFGLLVDNSIVVLENIYRLRSQGVPEEQASERGTSEVALAIIASTLTTVAVFLPFMYMQGELRIYYLPFAMAVGFSLLSSLLVAFTLIPALSTRFLKANQSEVQGPKSKVAQYQNLYQKFIGAVLRHKVVTLIVTALIFAGSYYLFDKYVTKGAIFRWGERTYLLIYIDMPQGAELAATDAIAKDFEEGLARVPQIEEYTTQVYPEWARIHVQFPDTLEQTAVPLILKERLTNFANRFAGVEARVYGFGPSFYGGGGVPTWGIKVLGYNYLKVKEIAEAIGKRLSRNPRVRNVDTSKSGWYWREDLFELVLRVNRRALSRFDLTTMDLLNTIKSSVKGDLQWSRIKIGGQEVDYRVKFADYETIDLEDLKGMLITTPKGEQVRLADIARISERKAPNRIVREDQQYQRWVSYEYRGPYKLGKKFHEAIIASTEVPNGYFVEPGEYRFMTEEQTKQIYFVLAISILLVFMITAALFESLSQPFVIMLTVPLALVGVFLAFFFTDTPFERSAYIGVILLGGIVVNNAIILVDHINRLRRQNMDLIQATVGGCTDRARPILMTTATTVTGLLPLLFFTKSGETIWYALALATIGGMTTSAFFTLTIIPVLYVVSYKIKERIILKLKATA